MYRTDNRRKKLLTLYSIRLSSSMEMSSIDDYVLPNKLLCNIIGLWPISKNATKFSILFTHFRVLFSLAAISNVFVPELLAIKMNWGDLVVFTGVSCVCTAVALLLFKMLYFTYERKRIEQLYDSIKEIWLVTDVPHERKSFENIARKAKILTILYFIAGFGNNITFTFAAVVDWMAQYNNQEEGFPYIRKQPFEVWYGFDTQSTPNFEIIFGCQSVGSMLCCVGIVGLDCFIMMIVLHVCGQFIMIQVWFRDIGLRIDKHYSDHKPVDSSKVPEQHFLNDVVFDIRKCVRHHRKILEVADQIEAVFHPLIFVQFITSALEICLSGFAVTTGIDNRTDLIKYTNYLMSMTVELSIFCWPGEVLIRESSSIGEAAYLDIPWYKLPVSSQRDLILVVMRAQKHSRITAAKFHTMSIEKLGQIFSTAVSYFALLWEIQEGVNEPMNAQEPIPVFMDTGNSSKI